MKHFFFGGVHPPGKKELTRGRGAALFPAPEQVILPLRQHIGAPCQPLVKVGEHVCMGQKIGDGEGLCVPIHASVSGIVTAIGPAPHPGGGTVPAITIRNDGRDTLWDGLAPHPAPDDLTPEELFPLIREAGIVGMGGAAFPTDVKSSSSLGRIDTLIINACECEPYITADETLICMQPRQVLQGIRLLAKSLKPRAVILAMEDNKPQAVDALQEYLTDFPGIALRFLPTRYPQGSEKQLILSVTGREVPPGKLPADAGCAVFNVSTAAAVARAVYEGIPLIRRIVSVTGDGIKAPQNFLVPIGTPFSALITAAGGLTPSADRVISGGPMMGMAQSTLDVPVVKSTGSILCLAERTQEPHPTCIRCGKCVEVCPMYLQPLYLYRYEAAGDPAALERLHLTDCIECGCCAYTCPGRLPLVDRFREGKCALRAWKEASAT